MNLSDRTPETTGGADLPRTVSGQKEYARIQVATAIRRGDLVREPCSWLVEIPETAADQLPGAEARLCGAEKTDAHHDDYDEPLRVRWLCRSHHPLAHRYVKRPFADSGTVSWRSFRGTGGEMDEPVKVVKRDGEGVLVLLGMWMPAWMIDEFDREEVA